MDYDCIMHGPINGIYLYYGQNKMGLFLDLLYDLQQF